MSENVVTIERLSRRFGKTLALNDISLQVQAGYVYGLVGANGQGKTTLIKHILGLLRAQQGEVRVFELDPVKKPVQVLEQIGYLSEERELPEWMRVDELLRYTSAYHPGWNWDYAEELLNSFQLDHSKKIKELSKGMRAQAGLIAAVSHRPRLLLLDEPSTGLDPIVRKDILNAIVRAVADDGRTTIFSSHLLDEVEQMSDYVFMIDRGRVVMEGELDGIKESHHWLNVRFADADSLPPLLDGVLAREQLGNTWNYLYQGNREPLVQLLKSLGGEVNCVRNASLQEIFVARAGRSSALGVAT